MTAGTAALRAVQWRVDGHLVHTDRVSGRRAAATLARRFAAGDHHVNATVVDAADRSSTRAVPVTAGTSPGGGGSNVDLRPRSIKGPRSLVGSAPFATTYRTNRTVCKYTWWYLDGRCVGCGRSVRVSLSPGRHDLHAERSVQSGVQTFTFPDSGTRVVADSGPALHVTALHGGFALVANATTSDPADDLRSLSLAVDGRRVHSVRSSGRTAHLSATRLLFSGRYTVTVTAVDARGQRARRTVTIRVGVLRI